MEELRRTFAQRLALKMLLDINQLKKTIKRVRKKVRGMIGNWA